jgi:mannosyltransferase OCH1-like enzyme
MFPKVIHQLWLQGSNVIPEKYKIHIEKIKNYHKNWTHIIWDETKILNLLKDYPKLLEKYYKYNHLHQKVDFSKFIILWHYGGIFLDIDVQIVKPFDKLFEDFKDYDFVVSEIVNNFIFSFATCGKFSKCVNNGIYIAKQKAHILEYFYNNLFSNTIFPTKILEIHFTTGPYAFNQLLRDYINSDDIDHKIKSKIITLSPDYFEPCDVDTGNCIITKNTYIKHVHEMSWIPEYASKILKFKHVGDYKNMIIEFLKSPYFTVLLIISIIILYFLFKSN